MDTQNIRTGNGLLTEAQARKLNITLDCEFAQVGSDGGSAFRLVCLGCAGTASIGQETCPATNGEKCKMEFTEIPDSRYAIMDRLAIEARNSDALKDLFGTVLVKAEI
jgi:hypothetical protein